MKNKVIRLLILSLFFWNCVSAQSLSALVKGTIANGSSANSVMLKIRSNETFSGQLTNLQFTVQIPTTVVPQPVVTIKNNPLSTYIPTGNYLTQVDISGGFYNYLFAVTTLGSPVFNFTNNVEINALELQISNGTPASTNLRFAHLPDGGTTGQLAFYIEVSGNENTDNAAMFYGTGAINGGSYSSYSFVPISNIVLPVKFTSFTAIKKGNDAQLDWTVENEIATVNNYEIERSLDGVSFVKITNLPKNTNGNTTNTYISYDRNLSALKASGVIYYRIKQIDIDGRFVYSEVRTVRVSDKNSSVSVYPNPVKDITTVEIDAPSAMEINMSLISADGKVLQNNSIQAVKGINTKKLSLSNYAAGSYLLKVSMGSESQTIKIIKK